MKRLWTTLRTLLTLLPLGARRFFGIYVVVTCSLVIFDVAALGLLALVIPAALSESPIRLPLLGEMPPESTPLLILVACLLIITKSSLALGMHWISTGRFARYELETGKRLFSAYIYSSWEERSKRTVAEITRIADAGIAGAISGFLVPLTLIPASISTFILVLAVLVVSDPLTALVAIMYLTIVAIIVNRVVTYRAIEAGQVNRDFSYWTANLMTEMVDALKELSLRNRLPQMLDLVADYRRNSVRARRNGAFLSVISGYAFEAALLGGFLIVGATAFLNSGLAGAVSSIALFAATGFRLIPALNGIQAGIVQASASLPGAVDVIGDMRRAEASVREVSRADVAKLPPNPGRLYLHEVHFRYPGGPEVLSGLNLAIPFGSSLGIVGPSGAGKSTLVDILLGLSTPTSGRVDIDGIPIDDVLQAWRLRVGYVPQRVALFDGTIGQNIALTWETTYDRERVKHSLEQAQLTSLLSTRTNGIDARIGERGVTLSGGQQQRLGIARALYADPLVLVLDEATSSLDTKTEADVSKAIAALQGSITLVSVAHRLSTIKDYDQICYLADGRILGEGSFAEVAENVPAFREQVILAGLAGEL